MSETVTLSVNEAKDLIFNSLMGAGTAAENASYFTDAILDTELSGLDGHGFYWLQFYCDHVKTGKVDGKVRPEVNEKSCVAFQVDAKGGFAHPAIEAGFMKLIPAAKQYGIAAMGIHSSYNAATLGYHTAYLAKNGLVSFGATNSPPAIAPVGGKDKVVGTNPLSFGVPGRGDEPAFIIDQSSSAVAWTAVKRAAEAGIPIPLGWALDREGKPTEDSAAGLAGSMAPAGGYKGFAQGLIVETLCAAVAGGKTGKDMGDFTESDGVTIANGQFFIAIDPMVFAGGLFHDQIEQICQNITSQEGARLPNARRLECQKRLGEEGLPIDKDLLETIRSYIT